ncbi:MAG: glutamate--tRNA ligase family protein [Acidimicrobiales bacterium]
MNDDLINELLPPVLHETSHWESVNPPRPLPEGAKVTRFAPSPTGFVHIGGVYTASISQSVAHGSGGTYFVRIEDTDQAREVADAASQFDRAFAYFGIASDESADQLPWGPYQQSKRADIYLSYVRELLRADDAYPCFCSSAELEATRDRQREAKLATGYYGEWATCRSLSAGDVAERLAAGGQPVIRLKTPDVMDRRVTFTDAIRGDIEQLDNFNDVVVLKSGEHRMPTYHFAHAVDDHLMRVNLVIRGEEWISSVPLHLQLFEALGFEAPTYAHVAPLMKIDGSSRRKLSKRKDPEASVDFYIGEGYPAAAVHHYLRGLANARLADLPVDEAASMPIELEHCGVSGPLVDLAKLDDITKDVVAEMPVDDVVAALVTWAEEFDPDLATALAGERERAAGAVGIGRNDPDRIRKDLGRWSQFREVYGFFLDGIFEPVTDPADERFAGVEPAVVRALAADFADGYRPETDPTAWFEQIRELAGRHRFALNKAELRENPDAFVGLLKDAAGAIRVLLTGSTRSPELDVVAAVLGPDEVKRRVRSVL